MRLEPHETVPRLATARIHACTDRGGSGGGGGGGAVLPRSGNDLGIVDAYPVSHPVSIIGDVYN